jgi:hypothetical protein
MVTPPARCHRPGIFPEPTARAALPYVLCLGLALPGCSRDARAVRLPALQADEEVYRITCAEGIELCRKKALEVCRADYEVLESTGAPVEPKRMSSAPGPSTTGPRYQRKGWQGDMVVACRTGATGAARAARAENANAPTEERSRPALAADQVCVPGATLECLGPAACRGAQACLTSGRGYGACDCGTQGGSTLAPPAQSPVPHGAPDAVQKQP